MKVTAKFMKKMRIQLTSFCVNYERKMHERIFSSLKKKNQIERLPLLCKFPPSCYLGVTSAPQGVNQHKSRINKGPIGSCPPIPCPNYRVRLATICFFNSLFPLSVGTIF